MTFEIAFVLMLLVASLVMFVSEKLPMDLVALIVLALLALTGTVDMTQALSGFSNPAVVTVWAMFILSDGLTRTGIADIIGRHLLRVVGKSETRIVAVVMFAACGLSAFMSNIGVAALMLPVVMDIAAKTRTPPSRLLLPLAYGTLLGGLTTLIGTPPNLLASESLNAAELKPFALFDYTPIGLAVMISGTLFMAFIGRKLLPKGTRIEGNGPSNQAMLAQYGLSEKTMVLRVPKNSPLHGHRLSEIRLGSALELSVLAISRKGNLMVGPRARDYLREGDYLLVQGRLDHFREIKQWQRLFGESLDAPLSRLYSGMIRIAEVRIEKHAPMIGRNLLDIDHKTHHKVSVIALRRSGAVFRGRLSALEVAADDRLLVMGQKADLEKLSRHHHYADFRTVPEAELKRDYQLDGYFFEVDIPPDSPLVSKSLLESRLGEAYSYSVLGIDRMSEMRLLPGRQERIKGGDRLLIQGERSYRQIIEALHDLEIIEDSDLNVTSIKNSDFGFAEAVIPPRSSIALKTIAELNFYDRYKLQLLAIWRQGKVHRAYLRNEVLHFGDMFLLFGRRKSLELLNHDPDILLLTPVGDLPKQTRKAPIAALIMAAMLVPVVAGWISIAVAAVMAAACMVLTGCLSMPDAYRSIEWRAIFLIAGMLPLGIAMEETGAAALLAEGAITTLGQFGPWPVVFGLYVVTALATTIIPTAALVVMMAPIVLKTSADLGIPPQTGMMAVAMAASASFTSPISHPANLLVMAPGGYRFMDYIKVGGPLALVVFLVTFLLLPVLWPVA